MVTVNKIGEIFISVHLGIAAAVMALCFDDCEIALEQLLGVQ